MNNVIYYQTFILIFVIPTELTMIFDMYNYYVYFANTLKKWLKISIKILVSLMSYVQALVP